MVRILISHNNKNRLVSVRVIGSSGESCGILKVDDALSMAQKDSLDLVMVDKRGDAPTCKILDYKKYMFDKKKKSRKGQNKATKTKRFSLSPNIEYHDVDVIINKALKNLGKGHRVIFVLDFKNRELSLWPVGREKMVYIKEVMESKKAILEKEASQRNSMTYYYISKQDISKEE